MKHKSHWMDIKITLGNMMEHASIRAIDLEVYTCKANRPPVVIFATTTCKGLKVPCL